VEPFVEDLTNWYVRRSRRRFWKSEHDADKNTAYATLYHILVKLGRLLAPVLPFVTEVMYQNLVCSMYDQAYESVHFTSYPQADPDAADDGLVVQMDLGRRIASLGLGARASANLKVRQPLSRVLVYTADQDRKLPDFLLDIIRDELNVKAFETVSHAEKLVNYRILPNNKLLGPRFGSRFPALKQVVSSLDGHEVNRAISTGEPVQVMLDGEMVELAAEEVIVETQPVEGLAVAADRFVTVAIDSKITPELRMEGLAREFVRRVQSMRKDAGFEISDRIRVYYHASDGMKQAMKSHRDYIMGEVLAVELVEGDAPEGAYCPDPFKFDGEELAVGIKRIEK
jgi:isoleucyl-tRNA synthetase